MSTIALGFRPASPTGSTIPDAGDLAVYDEDRQMLVCPTGENLIDTDLPYAAGTAMTRYNEGNTGRHFVYDDQG